MHPLSPVEWCILIGGVVFGLGMMLYGLYDAKRFRRMLKTPMDEGMNAVFEERRQEPLVPEFSTIDEIHAYYAKLKETDPKLAGEAMYRAQLKIHGA